MGASPKLFPIRLVRHRKSHAMSHFCALSLFGGKAVPSENFIGHSCPSEASIWGTRPECVCSLEMSPLCMTSSERALPAGMAFGHETS